MGKPDWKKGHYNMGGEIEDIPEPRVWYFPHYPYKRNVRVNITLYSGMGVHYYASVEEEDNAVWDPGWRKGEGGWTRCWGCDEKKGLRFDQQCNTAEEAERWVRETLRKKFPRKTHKYSYDCGEPKKWFYREGD